MKIKYLPETLVAVVVLGLIFGFYLANRSNKTPEPTKVMSEFCMCDPCECDPCECTEDKCCPK